MEHRRIAFLLAAVLTAACSSEESGSQPTPPADGPDASDEAVALPDASDEAWPDAANDAEELFCEQPASQPAKGPSGYALDGWSWTRHGVLFEEASAAATDGLLSPAAVVVGNRLHLWAAKKTGTQHKIFHAINEGSGFGPLEATSGLAGEDIIAYPSVLHDGTRFLMWYGSGTIDLAESQDGVAWTMIKQTVLRIGDTGSFDSMTVLYPSVIHDGTQYVMYYTGFDGQGFAIGRAVSPDGIEWTKPSTEPVMDVREGEFDNHAVAQPCAVRSGQGTLLWYGGYDTSVANPGPYRIGLATTKDGSTFDRIGVTLDLEASGVEAYSTRDPAVVRWQGGWWMAYVGMGDDRRYRLMSASSTTCAPSL